MATNYTTKTASLKATTADIKKIDAENITVWTGDTTNRKERVNLLDLISDSNIIYDDRGGIITEYDIWPNPITLENTFITTDTKGNISINHSTNTYNTFDYSEMKNDRKTILQSADKVIDNKVYGAGGQLLMNWETAAFTNSEGDYVYDIFNGSQHLKTWDSDLSSLTSGSNMFYITTLESFNGDLSSLTNGNSMFYNTALESFNGDLSSLTNGTHMFSGSRLTSWNHNLSSLTNGERMFYMSKLESFESDLSSLENGQGMFGCGAYGPEFTEFHVDMPKLTDGGYMFDGATKLTSFSGDLSSLENGTSMFGSCKLDAESVHNILHTINPDVTSGTITIGTNIINDSDTTILEAQQLEFAKVCLCDSWTELNADFAAKNWTVTWQFNGTATSTASTLSLTDSNISTALWAKLEEVTEENAPYKYVSEEDGKHYNIHWFHETNGSTDGYQYFGSLLEACGTFGVIPKEYAESNN